MDLDYADLRLLKFVVTFNLCVYSILSS